MTRFYVQIDVPADSPTISYTTDPLEQCCAVATDLACAHTLLDDCTVYTAEALRLQLQDEADAAQADRRLPVALDPPCGDPLEVSPGHVVTCAQPAGHPGAHRDRGGRRRWS